MTTTTRRTVKIYEDNYGRVYLAMGGQVWDLGRVTWDLLDQAYADASAWATGTWAPSEDDGQTRAHSVDGLTPIATWVDGVLTYEHDQYGRIVAGDGGRMYLGPEE